jgi:ribosomal protein S2
MTGPHAVALSSTLDYDKVDDKVDKGAHFLQTFPNQHLGMMGHGLRKFMPGGLKTYIINIEYTFMTLKRANQFLWSVQARNGEILFLNTKTPFNSIVKRIANKLGQSYINGKWVHGFLSNWNQTNNLKATYNVIEGLRGYCGKRSFRFSIKYHRKYQRLKKVFRGLTKLRGKPDLLVVLESRNHSIAIREAHGAAIPVIGFVGVDRMRGKKRRCLQPSYPILCNDQDPNFIAYGLKLFSLAPSRKVC